jgi:hypothetical protein
MEHKLDSIRSWKFADEDEWARSMILRPVSAELEDEALPCKTEVQAPRPCSYYFSLLGGLTAALSSKCSICWDVYLLPARSNNGSTYVLWNRVKVPGSYVESEGITSNKISNPLFSSCIVMLNPHPQVEVECHHVPFSGKLD